VTDHSPIWRCVRPGLRLSKSAARFPRKIHPAVPTCLFQNLSQFLKPRLLALPIDLCEHLLIAIYKSRDLPRSRRQQLGRSRNAPSRFAQCVQHQSDCLGILLRPPRDFQTDFLIVPSLANLQSQSHPQPPQRRRPISGLRSRFRGDRRHPAATMCDPYSRGSLIPFSAHPVPGHEMSQFGTRQGVARLGNPELPP
jgi:hypothetical protein